MKKIIGVFSLLIIIVFNLITSYSLSKYTTKKNGSFSFSVAKPICESIMDTELYISNYKQKPFYFSVCNFDKNGNISETAMSYSISINVSQTSAPLNYKLYRIYNDNSEEALELTVRGSIISTNKPISIFTSNKENHNYRLEIEYNRASNIKLDNNFSVSLKIESEQIKI